MRSDRLIKDLLRERFLVSLTDGSAIEGLLIDIDNKSLHLADCFSVTPTKRESVDGHIFIPRTNVLYMQKP